MEHLGTAWHGSWGYHLILPLYLLVYHTLPRSSNCCCTNGRPRTSLRCRWWVTYCVSNKPRVGYPLRVLTCIYVVDEVLLTKQLTSLNVYCGDAFAFCATFCCAVPSR